MTGRAGSLDRAAGVAQGRNGRLLDPRHHASTGPDGVAGVTAYHCERLLVARHDRALRERVRRELTTLAGQMSCRCEFSPGGVRLVPIGDGSGPDPWAVLSAVRRVGDRELSSAVGLDHLLTTAEQVGGNPFAVHHGRPGLDLYGSPGYTGRGPVSWVGIPPSMIDHGRRPRVVVLDTAIGDHPWFRADTVETMPVEPPDGDRPAVLSFPASAGVGLIANPMLGNLASHAGHGTFIAGLLRQSCPPARIVTLPVMGADGIVPETTLSDALALVLRRQHEEPGWADAIVLSLGYYTETGDDLTYTSALRETLLDLGRRGVAIFCAAGNDATERPSFPAAFAADPAFTGDPDVLPMLSVGARNPNGSRASFSNFGRWVTAGALGVNLMSTVPTAAAGSYRPRVLTAAGRGRIRSAVDPDSLAGGFASWSGTSFAAPLLAGRYLAALADASVTLHVSARRRFLLEAGQADRGKPGDRTGIG